MNTTVKHLSALMLAVVTFASCSQQNGQTPEAMLADKGAQKKILKAIANDHDLSIKMIGSMMENDHATGMMADGLIDAAAKDSVLAATISNKMAMRPDLMMLTVHHFMPVINASEDACEHFSEETVQQPDIAESVCKRMKEEPDLSCH